MNEKEKQEYLEQYKHAKEKGVPFFPDILFKDAVVSIAIFLILVALARFVGAPLEARANPSDNAYTPRPEWYFLFLLTVPQKCKCQQNRPDRMPCITHDLPVEVWPWELGSSPT